MDADFVGRTDELGAVINSIERGAGAVVTGPAGIGKTRLVMEAANASHLDVWWMPVTAEAATIPLWTLQSSRS